VDAVVRRVRAPPDEHGRGAESDRHGPDHGRPEGSSALGQLVRARLARLLGIGVLHLGRRASARLGRHRSLHDAHHRHAPDRSREVQRHGADGLGERDRAVRERGRYGRGPRLPRAQRLRIRVGVRAGGRHLLHASHAAGLGSGALWRAGHHDDAQPPGRRVRARHVRAGRAGAEASDRQRSDGRPRRAADHRRRAVPVGGQARRLPHAVAGRAGRTRDRRAPDPRPRREPRGGDRDRREREGDPRAPAQQRQRGLLEQPERESLLRAVGRRGRCAFGLLDRRALGARAGPALRRGLPAACDRRRRHPRRERALHRLRHLELR
jgi:hypothetical protein